MRIVGALLCLFLLTGCSTARGFDRGALSHAVTPRAKHQAAEVLTDAEIRRIAALRPQLPRRFRLGIYLNAPLWNTWESRWSWTPDDKTLFLELGDSLEGHGLVSETVFVSSTIAQGPDLMSIRMAAARHGVDAVLVVGGISDVDTYNNPLAALYALLVTTVLIPGNHADALFVSHAALWDVRNGYLYASVESDGEASVTRPAAMIDAEEVVEAAKERSLGTLAPAVAKRLLKMRR